MRETIKTALEEAALALDHFLNDQAKLDLIEEAALLMAKSIENGGKIISCGNGGSLCDAMHFAEELTGRYRLDRPSLPALSISDPSHITCVGNDYGYDSVFARYIESMGNEGDVLLAISTSGNSPNIIKAAEAALEKGMKIVALSGKTGGLLAKLADVEIRVTAGKYSDRIQEIHIKIIHILVELIEEKVLS